MPRKRAAALFGLYCLAVCAAVSVADAGTETINYQYDAKGRLVQVVHSGTVNNNVITNYSYDAANNRKNVSTVGSP